MINFDIRGKFQPKPKNRAGLDLGTYAIKMAEISYVSDNPTLTGLGFKKIKESSKEALAGSIKTLTEESKISVKDISISVSGSSVIVRFITMPRMKHDELKGAVRFEAEKFIPFNINDCTVDFQILKKDEKENKFDILLVAAKKDYIEERIKLVESCGFSVSVVDVDSFALMNSFLKNYPTLNPDKTVLLLNIGATLSNLTILKESTLCLVRDIAIGGNELNTSISKGLGVDIGSTEDIKLFPQEKMPDIITNIRPILNNLADEVRLSCSYYENQCGKNIDEIYISGGSSEAPGLDESFQEALGLKPVWWNPMQFLNIDSNAVDTNLVEKVKNSFAVAIGLALR